MGAPKSRRHYATSKRRRERTGGNCSATRSRILGVFRSKCEATIAFQAMRSCFRSSQLSSTSDWASCRRIEEFMVDRELRTALSSMVERFGFDCVSQTLRELEPDQVKPKTRGADPPKRARNNGNANKRRVSAVEYIRTMDISAERAEVIGRAAEEFERRTFLPTVGDVRNFCEVYGIEEPRSKTRVSGIPRIFKFLITMNAAEVKTMLDDRMFSGPAELGPIADAIRSKAKEMRMATQEPQTRTAALLQGGEQAQNARAPPLNEGKRTEQSLTAQPLGLSRTKRQP